ncbi:tail fiber domain-containing protein [bacterium]|nr:tail fiber domain-containing protein [bacterium]
MANEFKIKKGLIVTGADGGTVVDIQGSQGQLFSVTDDLSGSIFAVSDISGVPILDVNSSGTVTIDGLLTGDDATFSKRLTLNSPDYAQHLTMRRGIYGYDTIITGDRVDFSPTADTLNFKFLANLQTTGDVTLNNELNFTGSSYQISGGSSVGDMRFVAPRFRFYENTISGAAKLEIDGGNATFAAQAFSAATSSGDASSTLTTKGYVDGLITGATIYRGAWQAGISATSSAATTASTTLAVTAAILDADSNTPDLVGAVVTGEGITDIVKVASVTSSTVYVLDTAIDATATAYIFSPIYGAPDLSGVTETSGYYYICSEAGSATPNGADSEPNTWNVGDWCIYNDVSGTGQWQKIDNSSVLSGAGTGQTVALWEGPSSVTDSDTLGNAPITVSGNDTTFAGNVNVAGDITIDNSSGDPFLKLKTAAQEYVVRIDQSDTEKFQIRDTTNSATRLTIDSTGNVGIDTDSPSYKLDVDGDIRARDAIRVYGNTVTTLPYNSPSEVSVNLGTYYNQYAYIDLATSHAGGSWIDFSKADGTDYGGRIRYANSSDQFQFFTNNSKKMVIDSAGNVGIGTDSPSQKLTISQNATGTGQGIPATTGTTQNGILRLEAGGTYGECLDMGMNVATTYAWIQPVNKGNLAVNYNLALNPNGGNVGIGTTSPIYKLDVAGEVRANNLFRTTDGTNIGLFGSSVFASNVIGIGSSNAVPLVLGTGATERMRITSGGNVGIGTTSPDLSLTVKAGVDSRLGGIGWESNDGVHEWSIDANNAGNFRIYKGTTAVARFDSSGNFGIGTTSPDYKLDVEGDISLVGSGENYAIMSPIAGGMQIAVGDPADVAIPLVTFDGDQKVGIGTTSPGVKLQVNGGIRAVGTTSTTGQIDASPDFGAFRFYNGNTFRGGLGMGQWASVGNNADIVQYLNNVNYYISNGATALVKVEAAGNVGIGTTSPGYKLTTYSTTAEGSGTDEFPIVAGKANAIGNFTGIGLSGYIGANGAVKAGIVLERVNSYGTGKLHILNNSTSTSNADATLSDSKITILGNGDVGIGTTSPAAKLDIQGTQGQLFSVTDNLSGDIFSVADISGVPIMNVNSDGTSYFDGNVGIGTTNPGHKLDVYTNTDNGYVASFSQDNATGWGVLIDTDGVGNNDPALWVKNATSTVLWAAQSGNVGIGTTSPNAKLEVIGTSYLRGNTYTDILQPYTGQQLTLLGGGANTLFVNGKVGIGTTSPDTKLDVISGTNNGIRISATDTTDNWRDINIRSYVSQAQANALPSGSAIYTTNPSSQSETAFSKYGGLVLQGRDNGNSSFAIRLGNGNGYATRMFMGATGVTTFSNTVTATNFILSSDERKKTKIKDLTCDNINVNWKSFELKEDEGEYRTGVIAQELEQSHPEFVKTDDEGFKSVKYIDLLIAKIAELEARLEKAGI